MDRCGRLRPELEIIRTGPGSFVLTDPRTGGVYQFSAEERYLLHLLEGAGSPDEVLRGFEGRFGRRISRREVLEFVEQLRRLGLMAEEGGAEAPAKARDPGPAGPAPAPLSRADGGARLNFFFDVLAVLFGWLTHPIWVVPTLLAVLLALAQAYRHWDRFTESLDRPVRTFPVLPLIFFLFVQTILFVNLPRMLYVGMVCRRFGGRVRSFGVQLYGGLIPGVYCDPGDSFAQMGERGRWTLLWAMIWPYLAIGSLSVLAWAVSRPGSWGASFWVWLVPPCVLGTVLNWIIFFEFGAYWMVSYAAEEPRLCERALAETRAWLSGGPSPEPLTPAQRYWLRFYGMSYYVFHFVFDLAVWVLLGHWIITRFKGVGALVFAVVVLWWYADYLGKLLWEDSTVRGVGRCLRYLGDATGLGLGSATMRWLVRGGGSWWFRWVVRLGLVAGFVAIGFIPYSYEVTGECRVLPPTGYGVRAQVADEIVQVHVAEGDYVSAGAPVVTLSGRNLRMDVLTTEAELKKAEASLDLLLAGRLPEDVQVAEEKVKLYAAQFEYYDMQVRREEQLLRTKAASPRDVEFARRQRDAAREQLLGARETLAKLKQGYREEQVRAAEAQVKALEEKLKYYKQMLTLTEVRAPAGGVITTPYMAARKGQHTKVGDLIAVVQDKSKMQVEVAADDAAALDVHEGMPVHVRLYGTYGRLLCGRVVRVAPAAEQDGKFGNDTVRTDPETYNEQRLNNRTKSGNYHLRVYVELEDYPPNLTPEMYGYARIVVDENDVFWRAIARPVVRFLRTEVWYWLP